MRFKLRNALIGAAIYLQLLLTLGAASPGLALLFAIYAGGCMAVARMWIDEAERRKSDHGVEFCKIGAANSFGQQYGSFHHVFHSHDAVNDAYRDALTTALSNKLGCTGLHAISFKDVDKDLMSAESRSFFVSTAPETPRNTGFTLLCDFAKNLNVQTVRWWMLVSGVRDPNKVFWRYALAPFTVPFTFLAYLRREYDPLSGLMTVHPGFFNEIDVLNRTREMQYVAFETLVEVLESFGIDTSDLKAQKGNVLNINVSGGQTNIGNVVQGAMNKVRGVAGSSGAGVRTA